jgi:hypothetical protein
MCGKAGPAATGDQNSRMSNVSPLTGVIEESDVIVDFGQYEGQSVEEVKAADPDLYQQLVQEKENDNIAIRRNKDKTFRLYMNPLLSRAN